MKYKAFLLLVSLRLCVASSLYATEGPVTSKPFVIAHVQGQLGNNFYQVATASALAWDHDADVYFVLGYGASATVFDHVFFRCCREQPKEPAAFEWHEPDFFYHPIPFHPNMKIYGYFQSEKHFLHHRQKLLELFAPPPEDLGYIKKKYGWLLENPNTVGIQIRHYKSDTSLGDLYPQYGKEYLEKAMAQFPETSLFIVSSDNLEFARKNIPDSAKNVVFLENEQHYIDFYLLSFCRHNIITNSSFGWWSAWLNQNPNKKVVRPSKLINGLSTHDVYPKDWIVVEASYE